MRLTKQAIEDLALQLELSSGLMEDQEEVSTYVAPHVQAYEDGWRPKLNPIQQLAVHDLAIYKLYYGERASGKTYGAIHEMVEYCYRNDNALAYVIVKELAMGTEGGAWHKLSTDIIPQWSEGLGIEFKFAVDYQSKSPMCWIQNRHNGWSCMMLKSLPVPHQVEGKIKGREPGFILVDEAQTLETSDYFTALIMQLGRRHGGIDPSKIIFCCNPEGPSHWLYQVFFLNPVNELTGEWDYRYAHWHLPITDNVANLPERYYEDYVLTAVKNDPIAYARLVEGRWVDRPSGDSLFLNYFSEQVHVIGDPRKSEGLLPVAVRGMPLLIGYDLGAAHSSVTFGQIVETVDKIYKLVFDEIDRVGEYTPYEKLVPQIIERQLYWEERMAMKFQWEHISDEAAFNQYRATTGSFDNWDVEKISRQYVERRKLENRFVIRMKPCPKGEHSIEARVRMLKDDLIESRMLVSASCTYAKEMFLLIPEDKKNPMVPPKRTRYGHNMDSLSYMFFYYSTRRVEVPGQSGPVTAPKAWYIP